jgi:hypothetical protein
VVVGRGDLRSGAHGHGLELLGAHDRAEAAATRVAAVVRDRRELDQALARGPDGGDAPGRAEPGAQALLGLRRRQTPQVVGWLQPRALAVDEQRRRLRTRAAHDDRVVPRELARDREVARGQRVVEHAGERRLRHDGELRARGQRRADEG